MEVFFHLSQGQSDTLDVTFLFFFLRGSLQNNNAENKPLQQGNPTVF